MEHPPPPAAPCNWHNGRAAVVGCAACGAPLCPGCAAQIVEPGAPPWAAACPTCAPNYQTPSSVPLEDPAQGITGWPRTLWVSLFQPQQFFTSFRAKPLGAAVAYAYLTGLPGAVVAALLTWVGARLQAAQRAANPGAPLSPFGSAGDEEALRALLPAIESIASVTPLVLWALTPLSIAAMAGAFHLAARMFGGRAPFGTTYRACLFLSPLWLIAAPAPLCCAPIWFGWYGALMFHAYRRPHGMTTGSALAALGLAALFLGMLGCALGTTVMCGGFAWVGPDAIPR